MRAALQRFGTVLAAVALLAALALAAPNFTAPANLLAVLKQASHLAILATGFTLALVAGELDLSVGQVATLASVACAALVFAGQPWPLAAAAGMGAALACGLANGLCVTRLKIPSLIATLAVGAIATGIAFLITGGVRLCRALSPPASSCSVVETFWASRCPSSGSRDWWPPRRSS